MYVSELDPELFFPHARSDFYTVAIATARLLTQALSNIVTSNQNLVAALWETYLSLPEDQVILMYVRRTLPSLPGWTYDVTQPVAGIA